MEMILLTVRFALAAVFVAAGAAKLRNRWVVRATLIDFSAPIWVAARLDRALPLTELVVGAALLWGRTAWLASIAAAVLLAVFTAAIAVALRSGSRPTCRCFGDLHAKPIGWGTMVRNAALLAMVAIVVVHGPEDDRALLAVLGLLGSHWSSLVAATALAAVLAQSWILLHMLRQHGRLLLRLEEIESKTAASPSAKVADGRVGVATPSFMVDDLNGVAVASSSIIRRGRPALLAFIDPACAPCKALMPDLTRWAREYREWLDIVVISRGDRASNAALRAEVDWERYFTQRDSDVSELFGVGGTPGAVLIKADGVVASPPALGTANISGLVSAVARSRAARDNATADVSTLANRSAFVS